jgi:hypothetical protein
MNNQYVDPQAWRHSAPAHPVPMSQPPPPPLTHARSQPNVPMVPGATTGNMQKVRSKLSETAGFAGDTIASGLRGVSRFFSSRDSSDPPPLSWRADKEQPISLFCEQDLEAAFHTFRALVTREYAYTATDVPTLRPLICDDFATMFPILDYTLLQRLWTVSRITFCID